MGKKLYCQIPLYLPSTEVRNTYTVIAKTQHIDLIPVFLSKPSASCTRFFWGN